MRRKAHLYHLYHMENIYKDHTCKKLVHMMDYKNAQHMKKTDMCMCTTLLIFAHTKSESHK